ncbi:kunitz-type serine protease inhibitor-like [Amblyomma americanum]
MDSTKWMLVYALIISGTLTGILEAKHARRSSEQDNPTDQRLKNKCWLKPNQQHCKDYEPRWYYDTTYLLCKQYLYGGCGGEDSNAFKSHEQCMKTCAFEVPEHARSGGKGSQQPAKHRG